MSTKEAIIEIVMQLNEEEAQELLDFINMRADPDTLTDEEMADVHEAEREFERGEFITDAEFKKKYGL